MLHRVLIPVQILFMRKTDKLSPVCIKNIIKKKRLPPSNLFD